MKLPGTEAKPSEVRNASSSTPAKLVAASAASRLPAEVVVRNDAPNMKPVEDSVADDDYEYDEYEDDEEMDEEVGATELSTPIDNGPAIPKSKPTEELVVNTGYSQIRAPVADSAIRNTVPVIKGPTTFTNATTTTTTNAASTTTAETTTATTTTTTEATTTSTKATALTTFSTRTSTVTSTETPEAVADEASVLHLTREDVSHMLQMIPLNATSENASSLLVLSRNKTISPLPEFIVQSAPATNTTRPTTPKPSFNLGKFLAKVTSDILAPMSTDVADATPERNIPSLLDGSLFGQFLNKKTSSQVRNENRQSHLPTESPPRRGSVQNLNRPALLSQFSRPYDGDYRTPHIPVSVAPHLRPHPRPSPGPSIHSKPMLKDEVHDIRPGSDDFGSSYVRPTDTTRVIMADADSEPEVVTAPNLWNLVVSASLADGHKAARPHYGYVVDAAEQPEIVTAPSRGDHRGDHYIPPLLNIQSPSRLGLAVSNDKIREEEAVGAPQDSEAVAVQNRQNGGDPLNKIIPFSIRDVFETISTIQDAYAEENKYGAVHEERENEQGTYEVYDYEPEAEAGHEMSSTPKDLATTARPKLPFPYGVNLADISDSQDALLDEEPQIEDMVGIGAAFPEIISNSNRAKGVARKPAQKNVTWHPTEDSEEKKPVLSTDEVINSLDSKVIPVQVDVNQTTSTHKNVHTKKAATFSGEMIAYILIGTLGGLSLFFLCIVGVTIRCRQRRFRDGRNFLRRSSNRVLTINSLTATDSGKPPAAHLPQQFTSQLQEGDGQVANHQLGSWLTGRNTLGKSQRSAAATIRNQLALPTANHTLGSAAGAKVTRAYFTDGRTGSTKDLITPDSSAPTTPAALDDGASQMGSSWLHTSFKDRGNSISQLKDDSYYIISQELSDEEQARSANGTVRVPTQVCATGRRDPSPDRVHSKIRSPVLPADHRFAGPAKGAVPKDPSRQSSNHKGRHRSGRDRPAAGERLI